MTRHIHLAPHLSVDELAGQYRATKDPVERLLRDALDVWASAH